MASKARSRSSSSSSRSSSSKRRASTSSSKKKASRSSSASAPRGRTVTFNGQKYVKDYVQGADGSIRRELVPYSQWSAERARREMFARARPMNELDQLYAAQALGLPFTPEGRPSCIPGIQYRGANGKCQPIPLTGENAAVPTNTGYSFPTAYGKAYITSNNRVIDVPNPANILGLSGNANQSDLEDDRIKSYREGYPGAKWKPWTTAGYTGTVCGPGQLATPDSQCVDQTTMYRDGWRKGTYGSRTVARPYQLSYTDYNSGLAGFGQYGQPASKYSGGLLGPLRESSFANDRAPF